MAPAGGGDAPGERESESGPGGALAALIEVEEQIDGQEAEARAEAERIVREAKHAAQSAGEQQSASLDEAIDALRSSIEEECRTSLRQIREEAESQAARYREADPATLAELSSWVVSRVLRGSNDP